MYIQIKEEISFIELSPTGFRSLQSQKVVENVLLPFLSVRGYRDEQSKYFRSNSGTIDIEFKDSNKFLVLKDAEDEKEKDNSLQI